MKQRPSMCLITFPNYHLIKTKISTHYDLLLVSLCFAYPIHGCWNMSLTAQRRADVRQTDKKRRMLLYADKRKISLQWPLDQVRELGKQMIVRMKDNPMFMCFPFVEPQLLLCSHFNFKNLLECMWDKKIKPRSKDQSLDANFQCQTFWFLLLSINDNSLKQYIGLFDMYQNELLLLQLELLIDF